MIKLENVDKYYNYHMDTEVHALKNVNLTINDGEMVAIMGVIDSQENPLCSISSVALTRRLKVNIFWANMRFASIPPTQ